MENTQENITHACLCELMKMVIRQANQIEDLKMEMTQLAEQLRAVKDQLSKATAEIMAKVANLEAVIAAAGVVNADVEAALADVKTAAQMLDDLNPDPVEQENTVEPVGPTQQVLDENGNPVA